MKVNKTQLTTGPIFKNLVLFSTFQFILKLSTSISHLQDFILSVVTKSSYYNGIGVNIPSVFQIIFLVERYMDRFLVQFFCLISCNFRKKIIP